MPGVDGQDRETAKLRLASARRRVHAFLSEITTLEASEFPHADAEDALREIKRHFLDLLRGTIRLEAAPLKTIRETCSNIGIAIERYTKILGFLLRSTNVRNAFELYFPLRRLVNAAIGEDARLVVSSEWDFVPFTYPMNLAVLPGFVLVGSPASESSNALITPLAGHEIGHSAWRHHGVASHLKSDFKSAIETILLEYPEESRQVEDLLEEPDLAAQLFEIGMNQVEEVFCDCFGLFVFGESYAFAYEYLMFPGGQERAIDYPSDEDRIAYILSAATWYSVTVDEAVFSRWSPSPALPEGDFVIAQLVDGAVRRITTRIFEETARVVAISRIARPDADIIAKVRSSRRKEVPDQIGATLAEIVTAGWLHLRSEKGLSMGTKTLQKLATLNEVILKSIEVSEFLRRTGRC